MLDHLSLLQWLSPLYPITEPTRPTWSTPRAVQGGQSAALNTATVNLRSTWSDIFFHQHLKLFQSTTVGLGGEVVPRLQWREQWLGGNLKLENIFSKSNLVDGSFHFSFLMKQRLQSLKLPAMATKELNQNYSLYTFFFKGGPPPPKKRNQLEPSLKQLAHCTHKEIQHKILT